MLTLTHTTVCEHCGWPVAKARTTVSTHAKACRVCTLCTSIILAPALTPHTTRLMLQMGRRSSFKEQRWVSMYICPPPPPPPWGGSIAGVVIIHLVPCHMRAFVGCHCSPSGLSLAVQGWFLAYKRALADHWLCSHTGFPRVCTMCTTLRIFKELMASLM